MSFAGSFSTGWGNGYVCLPKGHPCYGMDYDTIHDKYNIDVNGGLTFACAAKELTSADHWNGIPEDCKDSWVVGFDTAHYGNDPEKWPKRMVEFEAKNLAKQFEEIAP